MAVFSGRRVNVGIGLETTRGTAVAPAYYIPELDVSMRDKPTSLYDESSFGNVMKSSSKATTLINGDGSISSNLWARGLYYWLALLFGQLPTTTDVSGDTAAKKHAFALLNSNEHLSATLALTDPNQDVRYPLAMIDSVKITWAVGESPKIEVQIITQKSASATNTVAYAVDSKFVPTQASFKLADALSGLAAASVLADIKSFSMEFKKNLSPQQTADSSDTYSGIYNTDFEVSGSIEKLYRDTTYRGYALQDTIKAMEFALSDSLNKAGTTTPTSLKFSLAKVAFEDAEPNYGLSDISTETLKWAGLMSLTEAPITAELINKYTYV